MWEQRLSQATKDRSEAVAVQAALRAEAAGAAARVRQAEAEVEELQEELQTCTEQLLQQRGSNGELAERLRQAEGAAKEQVSVLRRALVRFRVRVGLRVRPRSRCVAGRSLVRVRVGVWPRSRCVADVACQG